MFVEFDPVFFMYVVFRNPWIYRMSIRPREE